MWTETCGQRRVPVAPRGPQLDVQRRDAELFAALSDVLRGQHGGVWRRLVSVGLHLHPASHTADCLPGNARASQKTGTPPPLVLWV